MAQMEPVFNVLGAGRCIPVGEVAHDVALGKGKVHAGQGLIHPLPQRTVQAAEDAAKG